MTQKQAEAALARRKKAAKKEKPIDNSSLPAGSPMYYSCRGCGTPNAICLPENWNPPRPQYCGPCQEMVDKGWLQLMEED